MIPSEPKKLDMPFAYEGGRNEIPTTGGEDTGNASLSVGFPPITSQPLSQGGIPPQRKDFNGILYLLSAYAYYAQSGGLYAWDATLDYVTNCIITHNNNIYICVANNGASSTVIEPGTNSNYWQTLYSFLQSGDTESAGSGTNPVYVNNGKLVASTSTVGSGTKPVYLNNGTITASSSTVGSANTPVYLNSGTLTACTSTGDLSVSGSTLSAAGYVKFSNGLIIQWGNRNTTASSASNGRYTVTYPIAFTSSSSYVIVKNNRSSSSGTLYDDEQSFWNKTTTTALTRQCNSETDNEEWLAVGY